MPIAPGTLSGFDQLLSVSQEAIQHQLKLLYLTEIDPPIKDGPKHLINHEMSFHLSGVNPKTQKTFFHKDGLDTYVCCPQLELGGQSIKSLEDPDKYRIAVIRFKFRKAEDWEVTDEEVEAGKRRDSVFIYKNVYQDDDGEDRVEYPEVVVNGWEISWETLLDRRDIQDVFKGPADSTTSHVSISQGVKEQLQAVGDKNFQVSTIFCAMQNARLVRSFRLVDANGNEPTSVKNTKGEAIDVRTMVENLMNIISSRFTSQNKSNTEGLGPTPDNPFILGYTMSSKVPELKDVNPAAAAANIPTPNYFVPKSFRVNLSPGNQYSEGTMNYCMQTFRAMEPPSFNTPGLERQVDYGVDGAGRFPTNVFTKLKTKATPGSAEDIFMNHWIGSSVAPLFYLSPFMVGQKAAEELEEEYKPLNVKGRMYSMFSGNLQRNLTTGKEYVMTDSARSDRRIIAENGLDDPTESVKMEYDTKVKVSYENLYPLKDEDDDLKRRLKLTIGSYTHFKVKIYRRTVISHTGKAFEETGRSIWNWVGGDGGTTDILDTDVWLNFKYTFHIGTSATNRGSFEISNTHAEHLDSNGSLNAKNEYPSSEEAPGVWRQTTTHNWANTFDFAFDGEKAGVGKMAEDLAKGGQGLVDGALDDLVDSLSATVILPAGSVFMFKGFSTDDAGNVFTTINYDTTTGDEVQMRRAKDVLQSRWQAPVKPGA
ncbi:hypothetical protein M7I_8223 [Glarea lozoyensis 74030]|uniref:Uncharacterized protein n=1 Tax=Glarea lozoyensis (strain ATCC 74030 / MF5533) TaxID=1104152 RepID=H0EZF6_GLAL7|nr:hypothetical protein M7I_8223 [Glarea lozoyensis 74030]